VTPQGFTLADTIAQLLVTLAFLGLGYAGWRALGSMVDAAVQPMSGNQRRTRAGARRDRRGAPRSLSGRKFTGNAKCNDCGQTLAFVVMLDTGRRVPVDPWPVADGNVCAKRVGNALQGYVIAEARPPSGLPGFRRYAAHFGTCPDRARPGQPRRAKPKPEPPATLPGLEPPGSPR
jgi:hypothetical protein